MRIVSATFLVVALLALGCATRSSRIQANSGLFSTYPPEVQQQIRAGNVRVGFTEPMVQMALGDPDEVSSRMTQNETMAEVWRYTRFRPRLGVGLSLGTFGGHGHGRVGVNSSSADRRKYKAIISFVDGKVVEVEQFD